ncbi:MAG: 1-deoxy-D-xylulose-5-phosphate reductoisomerase [Nitrospirae bacterium]|nr:1-deoxy-D-xylulose-5-phosphate reductoisomerase [Nitrospirota bacterium]
MKKIILLGSTGSIGVNTLDVVSRFPEKFRVVGLTAGENIDLLEKQIRRFRPKFASILREEHVERLKQRCRDIDVEIYAGVEGMIKAAADDAADMVVSAIVGAAGLIPTVAAIRAGKDIALANKETMVMAGEIVTKEAEKKGIKILPVDSEHSAILQSLAGYKRDGVKRLILTASGGPFYDMPASKSRWIKPRDALRHPNWKMGRKITIDSATLMNKGLEVIEARWLFDMPAERIDVLIHPESIVHSMVEYIDGSVIAQLGVPDMRIPITYALSYPERLNGGYPSLDLAKVGSLTFKKPDTKRFPCLSYAYEALRIGGTMPAVLNAANEAAARAFLREEIGFLDIPKVIKMVMKGHTRQDIATIEDVLLADRWAREHAENLIKRGLKR